MTKCDWRRSDPKFRFKNTDMFIKDYERAERGPFVDRKVTKWEARRQRSKLTPAKVYYAAILECGHLRSFVFEPVKTATLHCRRCKEA